MFVLRYGTSARVAYVHVLGYTLHTSTGTAVETVDRPLERGSVLNLVQLCACAVGMAVGTLHVTVIQLQYSCSYTGGSLRRVIRRRRITVTLSIIKFST